ncbi:unnamed protein product [Urochloa decumbens]|uniref:KIB1-4 beta-propeller domain-containing protein n=1 Tax=Urochloa decumbens TaxID=240449 RepID=A0ABC9D4M0_9POAL
MANQEQPDWSSLPLDLLPLIGQRSRDAVTGVAAFRSVCRAWRAAVGPAPRLLLPRAGSEPDQHVLVFPLSRGWSVVVDARDASCHLSHLATGATAALPKLNAVRDGSGGGGITHITYEHRPDAETAIHASEIFYYHTYLGFTDVLRFAAHVPRDAPAATAGMTIMMYHTMQGRTGTVFCRPGDAAWTKVEKPNPVGYGFFDFAYHDGKMFGLDINGETAVYDAATLDVLHVVQGLPVTPKQLANKMYGFRAELEEFHYVHLVSLPTKLVLVRTSVKSSRPFDIFELVSTAEGLAWLKVNNAGNYELFVDGYHTAFRENGANGGTRIYYVHDEHWPMVPCTPAAYCYDVQDNKLECVYRVTEDSPELSTKPSWFLP